MTEQEVIAILTRHLPSCAVPYCLQLWKEKPFTLKIVKSRVTKVGDFTSKRSAARPQITLNGDLNPYSFLITYIHEVAHLFVFLNFSRNTEPHGEHWKYAFRRLMNPMLTLETFPEEILIPLIDHMENPKASSFADGALTKALRGFDSNSKVAIILSDLPEGSIFKLQNKVFQKGKLRRTRVLCKELQTKRQYLVPAEAEVTHVQLSLL
jgi:SprT protein